MVFGMGPYALVAVLVLGHWAVVAGTAHLVRAEAHRHLFAATPLWACSRRRHGGEG